MSNDGIYTSVADAAGVVELANTPVLGAGARESLGVRIPPPASPQLIEARAAGYYADMATPEDRERESRESDTTKFEELEAEVAKEQHEAAERIAKPLEPQDDDESN